MGEWEIGIWKLEIGMWRLECGDWNLEVYPCLNEAAVLCAAPLWGNLAFLAPCPFGSFAVKKVIDFVVNSNLVIVTTL